MEQFSFLLSELLSVPVADWYFYEFVSIRKTFKDYEGINSEEGNLLVTEHEINGMAPSQPGFYYWEVDMIYKSVNGSALREF